MAEGDKPKASSAKGKTAASDRTDLVSQEDVQQVAVVPATTILTPQQREILEAEEGTSEITAGEDGGELASPYKSDPANPESPLVYPEAQAEQAAGEPGEAIVGVGETAAQHESHVLINSAANIAERQRLEAEEGYTADRAARNQHEDAAAIEFQRIQTAGAPSGDDKSLVKAKAGYPEKKAEAK